MSDYDYKAIALEAMDDNQAVVDKLHILNTADKHGCIANAGAGTEITREALQEFIDNLEEPEQALDPSTRQPGA